VPAASYILSAAVLYMCRKIGVRGARNVPINEYFRMSDAEKRQVLEKLRFLSTKNWTKSPAEVEKARAELEAAMGHPVTDAELWITLETYEGNKILADDLLKYNRDAELITSGILSNKVTVAAEDAGVTGQPSAAVDIKGLVEKEIQGLELPTDDWYDRGYCDQYGWESEV
jgi:hypothetical protein